MAATSDTAKGGNSAQIAYWNEVAAETWTTLQDRIDRAFAALTDVALAKAAPVTGERVIDVGCGCGATVLDLARRIGPQGSILGLDVSEPMAALARRRVTEAGFAQARILVTDASAQDLSAEKADLLFSRFGVMFFDAPVAAFANLRQGMRPGGRMVFLCWRSMAENQWFSLPMDAAAAFLSPQPAAEPNAPGPFAFADPERVGAILADAGWDAISIEKRDVAITLSLDGAEDAANLATRIGALARVLREEPPSTRLDVTRAVTEALRPFATADGVTLGGAVWLVSATA